MAKNGKKDVDRKVKDQRHNDDPAGLVLPYKAKSSCLRSQGFKLTTYRDCPNKKTRDKIKRRYGMS